jgi:Rrf2 family cysteine metabolism transcriptional repressor
VRLTAKSEYGVLASIDLACSYGRGPVSAREIAERQSIPPRFLEQLFVSLRRAGIVTAVRGAHGGFALTRDPADITVLDVVEALEGPLQASLCDSGKEIGCLKSGTCAAAPVWARATKALRDVFATATLASLAGTQDAFDRRCADDKTGE